MWQIKISGALQEYKLSYSKFIDMLKKKNFGINSKMLAEIIEKNPDSFKKIVEKAK